MHSPCWERDRNLRKPGTAALNVSNAKISVKPTAPQTRGDGDYFFVRATEPDASPVSASPESTARPSAMIRMLG